MKRYVNASMSGKTQRQRDAAQAAADALWRFQTLGDFHDPRFDALSNEDVELLDSARVLLLTFAED